MGATLLLTFCGIAMLAFLSAPASPPENANSAADLGAILLLGVFLILWGLLCVGAMILCHKSRVPVSAYHELIATLPEQVEDPDVLQEPGEAETRDS